VFVTSSDVGDVFRGNYKNMKKFFKKPLTTLERCQSVAQEIQIKLNYMLQIDKIRADREAEQQEHVEWENYLAANDKN